MCCDNILGIASAQNQTTIKNGIIFWCLFNNFFSRPMALFFFLLYNIPYKTVLHKSDVLLVLLGLENGELTSIWMLNCRMKNHRRYNMSCYFILNGCRLHYNTIWINTHLYTQWTSIFRGLNLHSFSVTKKIEYRRAATLFVLNT